MDSNFDNSSVPTKRERELMFLVARGMQNKNIAHELNISENTVRAHICNIMRKYKLKNRTQIAMMFVQLQPSQQLAKHDEDATDWVF